MHPLFEDVFAFVKEILFPVACLSCRSPGEFLCHDCRDGLRRLKRQRCIMCQRHAPLGLTHSACQRPSAPEQLLSVLDYHDPVVADIIVAGKYKLLPDVFRLLGQIMASYAREQKLTELWPGAVIIFIPLAPRRQGWRSFNQSELLARELAGELSKLETLQQPEPLLLRTRMTKVQKELGREQRQKNLQNSFICRRGAIIKNKKILLIDDVTTTGTTLLEASKVLKHAGAAQVACFTLAQD